MTALCYDRCVEEVECTDRKEKTMEKYTDLEQAVRDPLLAVITEDIATQRDLNRVFVKYKVLPRGQRRYSDYYSNEFLGHSVPEMYYLVKHKLGAENSLLEDWQQQNEKYVVSEPDLYYREDSFNSGDTNICFILGHSGSGKSMMAQTLVGEDIDHIELDDLLLTKDHFTMDALKDYSDILCSFFAGEGAKYYIGLGERDSIPKEEYEDRVFIDFVKYAMDYAKQHRDKKYIIEGIWLYLYFDDPSLFDDYAVFIKGTSFLKSKIRAMKREKQRDKEELENRKQMFGREVRNYLLDEDKIDVYREYFGSRPGTIFRSEANLEAEKTEEMLDSINKCFVHDDADGIRAIMKEAETSTVLTAFNKMRVFNEGQAALFDLRIEFPGREKSPV